MRPTFDDNVPASAHDDVCLATTTTAHQTPPLLHLDMPRPHLASPQPPHLSPPQLLPTQALNAQSLNRRPLPHVRLKTPRGQTAHLLNHQKLMTQKERRRNKKFIMPKPDYVTQTTQPHHRLHSPIPKLHRHLMGRLQPNSDEQSQKTGTP